MAKHSTDNKKKGIVKLNFVVKKLQKSLLLRKKWNSYVPEDVEEGHFAVIAMDSKERKRFVVPLSFLNHPTFVSLLEQAAEEFGFEHEGVLAIPCHPCELERILQQDGHGVNLGFFS